MDKFTRAQLAYDHRLPPEDPVDFLETSEGRDWLKDSGNALVHGYPVTWRSRSHRGSVDGLPLDEVQTKLLDLVAQDEEYRLAELVRCVASHDTAGARTALDALFSITGRTAADYLQELAEETLTPHADDYAKALRENNEDDEALSRLE